MAGNDNDHLPPPPDPPLTQVAKEAPTARLGIDFLRSEESRMERSLHTAMNQICVLNRGMSQLLVRYNRTSVTSGRRAHRYHLRLRMAVLEGVRAMYYEYAIGQTDELNSIRDAIKSLTSQHESDSDELVESTAAQRADQANRRDSGNSQSDGSDSSDSQRPGSNASETTVPQSSGSPISDAQPQQRTQSTALHTSDSPTFGSPSTSTQ